MTRLLSILLLCCLTAEAATYNWTNTAQINSTPYVAGDTVKLWGTFTSAFTVTNSGTPASPITFQFQPGANFTSGCWPVTGGIAFNGASNIVLDGAGVGFIQNTNNGTYLATNDSKGINGYDIPVHNVVIKNLTITNIYHRIIGIPDSSGLGYPVLLAGSGITVSNCNISDGDCGLEFTGTDFPSSNILVISNVLLNCNHTMFIGTAGPSTSISNLTITGNTFNHFDVWDTPSSCSTCDHMDGIIFNTSQTNAEETLWNVTIANNIFGPYIGEKMSGFIFNGTAFVTTQCRNWYIYNNLFLCGNGTTTNLGTNYPWNTSEMVAVNCAGSNAWLVNNTLINPTNYAYGGAVFAAGTNAYCYNNILATGGGINLRGYCNDTNALNSNDCTNVLALLTNYCSSIWSDYNDVFLNAQFGLSVWNATGGAMWQGGIFQPIWQWQTYISNNCSWNPPIWNTAHCDPHSTTNIPIFLGQTFIPATNDTVTPNGTNLYTALVTSGKCPGWAYDAAGIARSSVGTNAYIGAYNAQAAASPSTNVVYLHIKGKI